MLIPGLSGHEDRVRRAIAAELSCATQSDRLGNLWTTIEGDPSLPSLLIFAHMDQLGFILRKIEPDGTMRLERLGGVPERALLSQRMVIALGEGRDIPAIIGNKSHHATQVAEKYQVPSYRDLVLDAGFTSAAEAKEAGVRIGAPVVYAPQAMRLAGDRIAGTSVDDRAACAVLIALVQSLNKGNSGPTVHIAWSVQEEFNLRGIVPLAQRLNPDCAIQLDLMLASDTPDMAERGNMQLGQGPGMSLYSFHGRGTLNGVIPHPAMVALAESAAERADIDLQRSAQTGILTDLSYVQTLGEGVACLDLGFPARHTHSSLEMADLGDLASLLALLQAMITSIDSKFTLDRDAHT
ncbi:M20/M25/M40 family metallo-hydrolase [Candidatus Rhodobacter oscarellae]|nr:M20/M25/M40 family metallo-hydrolase [Candidatus Rhodobacter lobularis]